MKAKLLVSAVRSALCVLCVVLGSSVLFADYVPLANTVRKLKAEKKLRVAILGDSIGWGQCGSKATVLGVTYGPRVKLNSKGMPKGNPMGYARTTTDYIKKIAAEKYGVADKDIETFYSVWGGATSFTSLGYFGADIVSRRPDLLVMEIWNPGKGPDEAVRYTESMLRILWKTCPETDVLLLSVGGCFERGQVWQPLVGRYKTPYIDAMNGLVNRMTKFGSRSYTTEHYLAADGKINGSCELVFCHGAPHVPEEGYSAWNDVIVKRFDELFAAASEVSGRCEPVAPAGSLEAAPLNEKGDVCMNGYIVAPRDLEFTEGEWKVEAKEIADEPRDTMDRANSDKIVALKEGAVAKAKVKGLFLWIRGSNGIVISVDGKDHPVNKDNFEVRLSDKDDVEAEVLVKATKKGASINEFYVYGKEFAPVSAKPSKHRWSVKYYARVQDVFVHDWHLFGEQLLPHPLVWLNVLRDEAFSGELTVPGEEVLHHDIARRGEFLGWVEPDSVKWVGGEPRMVVKSNDGKRVYKPGEKIDVASLKGDLTLVAAFADGPLPTDYSRTVKASFVMENKAGAAPVALLDASAADPVVTMPDFPKRHLYVAKGWKIVNTDKVYQPGEKVKLETDTLFAVVWELDAANAAGVRKDGAKTIVDYCARAASTEELFDMSMENERTGRYVGKDADGRLLFRGNGHDLLISREGGLRIEAVKKGAYWKHPTFYGMLPVPVKRSETKTITVNYSYLPKNPKTLAGQHMSAEVFWESADGYKTDKVRVNSDDMIAVGEDRSVTFTLPECDNPKLITGLQVKFYEVLDNPRLWRPKSTPDFHDGDVIVFKDVVFR